MAIKSIQIEGFRSIANARLDMHHISLLIGENGSGKSNILSALSYFYSNLLADDKNETVFDNSNRFHNEVRIQITYNLERVLQIIQHNLNHNTLATPLRYITYYKKVMAISRNGELTLELRKVKGKSPWWNVDYNTRQIVSSLFPLYFIDARQIQLTDWGNLWTLIGDLIKPEYDELALTRESFQEVVHSLPNHAGKKLAELQKIFKSQGVALKETSAKEFAGSLSEIFLEGKSFLFQDKALDHFSNGTNAYNYTNVLIEILGLLYKHKLKEPIIVSDEPEISLHHTMIDQLMYHMTDTCHEIQYILSTHSSRIVKNMLETDGDNFYIYHVSYQNGYSRIKRLKSLGSDNLRERVIISDTYVNSYFAGMVVSIEGESELELFKNKYLCCLHPMLREIDFIRGMSNQVVHNIISPSQRNHQVPTLSVIDLDKVLEKRSGTNAFRFNPTGICDWEKEAYCYGNKRTHTLAARKRIQKMAEGCRFYYKLPFFSCNDPNYRTMVHLIQSYLQEYQIFAFKTTVEGALITHGSYKYFYRFIQTLGLHSHLLHTVSGYIEGRETNEILNYLRLLVSGKTDYLLGKKQLKTEISKLGPHAIHTELWDTFNLINKTSGWISAFLEYYFLSISGISCQDPRRFQKFKSLCSTGQARAELTSQFSRDFYELHHMISKFRMTYV